jgi:hypothetical protein
VAAASCQKPDSILLVEVASVPPIEVAQLQVVISAGLDSTSLNVPPVPGSVTLPTNFTVELDRSRGMPVQVAITALDGSGSMIACGTTVQDHYEVGGQTVITVFLQPCGVSAVAPIDAGAD